MHVEAVAVRRHSEDGVTVTRVVDRCRGCPGPEARFETPQLLLVRPEEMVVVDIEKTVVGDRVEGLLVGRRPNHPCSIAARVFARPKRARWTVSTFAAHE